MFLKASLLLCLPGLKQGVHIQAGEEDHHVTFAHVTVICEMVPISFHCSKHQGLPGKPLLPLCSLCSRRVSPCQPLLVGLLMPSPSTSPPWLKGGIWASARSLKDASLIATQESLCLAEGFMSPLEMPAAMSSVLAVHLGGDEEFEA